MHRHAFSLGDAAGDLSLPSSHVGYIMVSEAGGGHETVVEVRLELRPRQHATSAMPGFPSSVLKMSPSFYRLQNQTPPPVKRQNSGSRTGPVHIRASSTQRGVFFRRQSINFGSVPVGSICQQKVELCNATSHTMVVYLSDPCLPFVLMRNEIAIRPQSFVNVLVRFVPGTAKFSSVDMTAQTLDGSFHFKTLLLGAGV